MTDRAALIPTRIIAAPLGALAFHPIVCGECGRRPGHVLARACTSTACPVRHVNDDRPHPTEWR